MSENENNMPMERNNHEYDFYGIFNLSYADFARKNGILEPSDELLDKWIKQTVERFSQVEPVEGIVNFFQIPQRLVATIKNRQYDVTCEGVRNNNLEHNFMIRLHLKVQHINSNE